MREQFQRYIRLTELIPELLSMVDEKKIAFNPAVELSYLETRRTEGFSGSNGLCPNHSFPFTGTAIEKIQSGRKNAVWMPCALSCLRKRKAEITE